MPQGSERNQMKGKHITGSKKLPEQGIKTRKE